MLELSLKVLIAYLMGSINGSLAVGKVFGGVDVRKLGSGNAGGTNALRTQGPLFALLVVIIDVGKGVLAAGWVPMLMLPGVDPDPRVSTEWLSAACGAAAVIGHMHPFWFGFRGGKGGATLVGALAVLAPASLIVVLSVWLAVVAVSRFVGLATMVAAASVPVFVLVAAAGKPDPSLLTFSAVTAALVIFAHRGNITRMRAGTESRVSILFRRLRH